MGFVGFEQWKRRSELMRSGGEGRPEDRREGETKWFEEEEGKWEIMRVFVV